MASISLYVTVWLDRGLGVHFSEPRESIGMWRLAIPKTSAIVSHDSRGILIRDKVGGYDTAEDIFYRTITEEEGYKITDGWDPDHWVEKLRDGNREKLRKKLSPKNLLSWTTEEYGSQEAQLGTTDDGVLFELSCYPTCYRRGPYRLLITVLPGKHHHKWGCFDEADQPMRFYHEEQHARQEAEAIARVLWRDRHAKTKV